MRRHEACTWGAPLRRRALAAVAYLLAAVTPLAAQAQETGKVPRVGMLTLAPSPLVEAFKQGMRDLGYVEGKNVVVEYRFAEGREERVPGLVADLVRLEVDVIVAASHGAVAVRQATTTIE